MLFCTQKPPIPETVPMHYAKLTKPELYDPPKARPLYCAHQG